VPDYFEFKSGDHFAVKVNLSAGAGYIYVVNRTLKGSPEKMQTAARGMALLNGASPATPQQEQQMLANAQATATDYVLVYPTEAHKRVTSGWITIPAGGLLKMDNHPGIEKLYVIISPAPMTRLRDLVSGAAGAPTQLAKTQMQQEIRTSMKNLALNTQIAEAPIPSRGVQFVSTASASAATKPKPNVGVAAPVVAAKPYLIEITLVHR